MDLEEWELLSDDGFLDDLYDDDGGRKKISLRNHGSNPKSVFNMNYFICPSPPPPPPSQKFIKPTENPNQLVPVPIQLDPSIEKPQDGGDILEKIKAPTTPSLVATLDGDQDNLPQFFFMKLKEPEFVDMKMDSPKSSSKGIMLQIDPAKFQFDDKSDAMEIMMPISPKMSGCEKEMVIKPVSPKMKRGDKEMVIKNTMDSDIKREEVNWEDQDNNGGGGLNIWKLSVTGVGALCSIGAAAATICILIFGNTQRFKHQQNNQKLRFQIYTDDKRIKQVVHHATRLNEAISAVRGVPLTRAHITFGGYYDGL